MSCLVRLFLGLSIFSAVAFSAPASATLPAPTTPTGFACRPLGPPFMASTPGAASPLGVLSVSNQVALLFELDATSPPVDLYIAAQLPDQSIWLLNSLGQWQPYPAQVPAYRTQLSSAMALNTATQNLFMAPLASLPPGTYQLYTIVVPTGTDPKTFQWASSPYYLWCFTQVVTQTPGTPPPPGPTPPAPAPTVSLAANPGSVTSGASTTLNWSSTNASSCDASGAWSGNKSLNGSEGTGALTSTSNFTLTCTGTGGSANQSATVTVNSSSPPPPPPAPTVSLAANPGSVASGAASTLSWSSTNATSCDASGAWSGAKSVNGSEGTGALTATSTYTLTCNGSGGSANQSTTVTVNSPPPPPPPPPPPVGSTLTSVTVTNYGATGDTVVTFGQAFKPGEVPAGTGIGAALDATTSVALQTDKKAFYPDGSLKHAVLTGHGPMAAGQSVTLNLFAYTPGASDPAVTLAELLATSFDSVVTLNIGGTNYSASARDLLLNSAAKTWLSGPEVSEWIVGGPVKTSGGAPHDHLAAYFHVRAYAGLTRVRVDAVVENNWTFKTNAGRIDYTATVTVGNNTIYNGPLAHYHHSRWHQVGWWGNASNAIVLPDRQHLRDTQLVPNYANLTLQDTVQSAYAQSIVPMSNANLRVNWGDTGYDRQIGLMPEWYAAFIISGDVRAYWGILANDSASGSYSYHYRDENTGYPVSIDTHPNLSEQGPSGGLIMGSGGNAYSHEPGADPAAHQPQVGYLAYLMTGDYFYLEEMQFLGNYNMIWKDVNSRKWTSGNGSFGLVGLQNRGQAWGLRSLSHAAALTPDDHPLRNYFVNKTNNNITAYTTDHTVPGGPDYNVLGAIQDYDWPNQYSPWQNDFFVGVYGRLVELGFTNATAMRDWLARWPTGRMGGNNNDSGYCWKYATQYNFPSDVVQSGGAFNTSFAQLYQENFPVESQQPCPTGGLMTDSAYPAEATAYYSVLRPAMAMAVDAGVASTALWNKYVSAGTPNYSAAPVWAVVPRSTQSTPPPTPGPGAPTVSLSANPNNVVSGGSSTLTWSSTNATDCNASGAWGGAKLLSGSESTGALTTTSTFTLTCNGAGGSASLSVTISVNAPPPPPGGNPIGNLQPGQWHVFPNSNMSAVDPCPANNCSYTGNEGQAAVMNDWAGGAYDHTRDRLMVWGGGHGGYGGNEVYAFTLTTGTWSRLTEPSNPITTCTDFYPDGRPASTHSYNFLQYIPALDSFTTFSAGQFCSAGGAGALGAVTLNLATNTWSKRAPYPAGSHIGAITAYDASTGYVWMKATGYSPNYDAATTLYKYDPVADTWTAGDTGNSDLAYAYGLTAAIDHIRHKMVAVGEGKVVVWDISDPLNVTRQNINSTGANSIISANDPGLVYDPVGDRFIAWDGGANIYTLNPDTWVWTLVTPAASNTITPTAANSNGTYGRFRYVPSLHALIVVNRTNENVYLFKFP